MCVNPVKEKTVLRKAVGHCIVQPNWNDSCLKLIDPQQSQNTGSEETLAFSARLEKEKLPVMKTQLAASTLLFRGWT